MSDIVSTDIAIKIQNVWKIFGNTSKEALDAIQNKNISKQEALENFNSVIGVSNVSFDVKNGEIFCVMGLSGSGKSTLVRHINRLHEPTSRKILINNQDVMQFDKNSLQELRNKKIGMVFQNFALMPHRSVLDNIAMPLEIRGVSKNDRLDAANNILNIVELYGWGNKYAHELSGGMQQRVGLARALAADPEFLLMDEPFSALDPLIRRQLQTEFIKLSKQMKKTTVFITHDLDEAVRVGHRIAIMRDGMVVQIGTPEEIVVNPADKYVAEFVKGRQVNEHVSAMIVPGSGIIKRQAEEEGLDRIFTDAGFDWRQPGCSMCLAMNDDVLKPGERCASTSNRNFEGRQGKGGRTHLVSPLMAAVAAIAGHFTDPRTL